MDESYLSEVLEDQTLKDGSQELRDLQERRKDVEELLRDRYAYGPSIRYGGSYKKGTMIRDSYDLDIICYFARDDRTAGSTLEEIYEDVEEVLRAGYWTERKGSAIRIRSRDDLRVDFHIDVVPGRFVEGKGGDVHLYRSNGDKKFLKTNLETHISHVQESGVVPAIRLMKLWAQRRGVQIKTFALELLVIKVLEAHAKSKMADHLELVLSEFRDHPDNLSISDPANGNNDLSMLLDAIARWNVEHAAKVTLELVEADGWSAVFGPVATAAKASALAGIASSLKVKPKPYHRGRLV